MNRRGQSTAEYAIVLGVVVAALVAMQVYVKRGVNARLKDASDSSSDSIRTTLNTEIVTRLIPGQSLPERTDPLGREYGQYEPNYASSDYTVTKDESSYTLTANEAPGGAGKFQKSQRANTPETTTRAVSGKQETAAAPAQ